MGNTSLSNVLADGLYSLTFDLETFGGASADVVIDRDHINSSSQGGGTTIGNSVPEPATLALPGLGLTSLDAMFRSASA